MSIARRQRQELEQSPQENYFAAPRADVPFLTCGCHWLDLALGGGWGENRIINIVGDKSTGKTLLCIEAAANFVRKYPKGKVYYREAEAAFDPDYAKALGMPWDAVDQQDVPLETVEDMFEDLEQLLKVNSKQPALYILDSLDALSDRDEMQRDMDEGSYGAKKAKQLSQMFRRVVRKLAAANVTVIIVSQVRDKIGISFGRKTSRSGGKALDFYASQVVYLNHIETLQKLVMGQKRPYGVRIRAKIDKNKLGLPFREAEFCIRFGYGIDDYEASIRFLESVKALAKLKWIKDKATTLKDFSQATPAQAWEMREAINAEVSRLWWAMEKSIIPTHGKYDTE